MAETIGVSGGDFPRRETSLLLVVQLVDTLSSTTRRHSKGGTMINRNDISMRSARDITAPLGTDVNAG